ncbi:hypothetical protein ACG83_12620 [Frankia sp. R43]|uniref:hypothetical protein n=1 Tax=Frankia sp. R43 TaxID=269536 RepID=UPI0006CA01BE|nr:hypothetical protein [Frankia sp. R43]KPM56016.1 hypothetical protein ACG83_12620 [Frankia sp. R43]
MSGSGALALRIVRGGPEASDIAALVVALRALDSRRSRPFLRAQGSGSRTADGRPAWTAPDLCQPTGVSWTDR